MADRKMSVTEKVADVVLATKSTKDYGDSSPDTYDFAGKTDLEAHIRGRQLSTEHAEFIAQDTWRLKRSLKNRHMQMIAIGGAIGAGLFVGSGKALQNGGPASLLICFMIIGFMMLFVVQALGELAVMYPINGSFTSYFVKFLDPSWGFAMGWQYALSWLVVVPFEITAAGLTISYWHQYNIGIWIAVFLVFLVGIQFFGVRGYGEVEFVLSIIKIMACIGFIIYGIIVDCGGVPTDNRGYIGARYWHDPGAFHNGFKGFASVFVTASFAFGGTELVGLAAAESDNPAKALPKATKQVFWRITFFYVVNLFILGLIVPYNEPLLLGASNANTKASAFVVAMKLAGTKVLPSIFNAVITISVISVANSGTYGSTRTIQSLATQGMAPKFLAYVDKKGRPIPTVILQVLFGLLAFVNLASSSGDVLFTWLLALSGLANFFVWGSICLAHIRFRKAWKLNGRSLQELPYKAPFGIYGSIIGLSLNFICLAAQFYTALFPLGGSPDAEDFFEAFLAAPVIIFFYLVWKIYSWFVYPSHRPLFIRAKDIDIFTGLRADQYEFSDPSKPAAERRASIEAMQEAKKKTWKDYPRGIVGAFI